MKKKSTKQQVYDYVLKNQKEYCDNIAAKFKTSTSYVWKVRSEMVRRGVIDSNQSRAKTVNIPANITKTLRDKNRKLESEIGILKRELEVLSKIENYNPKRFIIPPPIRKDRNEAAAIAQWSDWHCEEEVLPETINGVNEYNLSIAKQRATALFTNTIKLIQTQRNAIEIPDLILQLGGDFMTGYIHPEGEQTNLLSPVDASFYAIELLVNGLEYLLQYGKFRSIKVICNRGNHGRTTKRMQSNDYEMNYEAFIFYSLVREFKNEKSIDFQVAKGSYAYVTVYERLLRFFHGHQVKFKGGIGGLTIPLYKLLHRLDQNRPAYYNFMCDKHTYSQPTPDCQCNGSLIGFNSYADDNGFKFQEPLQSLTILDSRRGITIKAPIFCQ